MKGIAVASVAAALGLAALTSAFLHGAFGYQWWVEIPRDDVGRAMLMMAMHVLAFVCGVFGLTYLLDRPRNAE